MRLSMHSICIERRYPLLDAIKRAAELGYQGYEIDVGDFGSTGLGLHWPEEFTAEHVEAAGEAARRAGIEISSLCLGVLWRFYPSSPEESVRAQAAEIIRQAAPFAARVGARVILLPVGQPKSQPKGGSKPRKGPAATSNQRPQANGRTREVDMDQMRAVIKKLWGELPQHQREQMLQLPIEEFLPKYQLMIEEYFRRLAEEKQP